MIYSFDECLKQYDNYYQIIKLIEEKRLFKIQAGLYSDIEYVSENAIIMKKYPNAVFTLNSAFYYQQLTDSIPDFYYLMTDKNASKISDAKIKQSFDNYSSMNLGTETIEYNGDNIRLFNKERLLIELIRNKPKLPYDYYKEIVNSYRQIIVDLDYQKIEEYTLRLPKSRLVLDTIRTEVL